MGEQKRPKTDCGVVLNNWSPTYISEGFQSLSWISSVQFQVSTDRNFNFNAQQNTLCIEITTEIGILQQ